MIPKLIVQEERSVPQLSEGSDGMMTAWPANILSEVRGLTTLLLHSGLTIPSKEAILISTLEALQGS